MAWMTRTRRPAIAAALSLAVLGTVSAAPASAARANNPLTASQRHAMGALRDLSVQRIVLLQGMALSAPAAARDSAWAIVTPVIASLRQGSLTGGVLSETRIVTGRHYAPQQPLDALPSVPITALCTSLADPGCVPLADAALDYLAATRTTASNEAALLLTVQQSAGRRQTADDRARIQGLLDDLSSALAGERTTGRRLVARLGSRAAVASRAQIEAMIRRVQRDPWLVVPRQQAVSIGLHEADVRRLIVAGVPAARKLEGRRSILSLLGTDYLTVRRGISARRARARAAQAADGVDPVPGVAANGFNTVPGVAGNGATTVPGVAAGGATTVEPTDPCAAATNCNGATFSTDAGTCKFASARSGQAVDMTGATLAGCDLSSDGAAQPSPVDARKWILRRANLTYATLTGIQISSAPQADFGAANLTGAKMSGADLRSARFVSARLVGADLSQANVTPEDGRPPSPDFSGADLSQAVLRGTTLVVAKGLERATLVGADLSYADLSGTALNLTFLDDTGNAALSGLRACMAMVLYPQYRAYSGYPTGGPRCP